MVCYFLTFENLDGLWRRRVVACMAAMWLLAHCSSPREVETRRMARALIEQLQHLEPDAAAAERERALSALAALRLRDAELRELRDTCVRAHRGLLAAQAHQQRARDFMAGIADGREADDSAPLEALQTQGRAAHLSQAAQALASSNETLAAARFDLSRCRQLSGPVLRRFR